MNSIKGDIPRILTYTGLIFVSFELVKGLIVNPIKAFYKDMIFVDSPFKSFEEDVSWRHKDQFEASLLYLRDFMEAITTDDMEVIQSLRKHRNQLAHNLPNMLTTIDVDEQIALLDQTDKILFKLSNYRAYMEVGSDPKFNNTDWAVAKGREYLLFEEVLEQVKALVIGEIK